jgi:hypothetical protein
MDTKMSNGRFMTEEGKKRFLIDWKNKNERLLKIVQKENNKGYIKITLGDNEITTFAKDLDDAKILILEAVLAKKINEEKFGK